MSKKFRITYTDPETGEETQVERTFEDTPAGLNHGPISAWEWAEDCAYMLADKGPHRVEELS